MGIEEALPYASITAQVPYPLPVDLSVDTLAATAQATMEDLK